MPKLLVPLYAIENLVTVTATPVTYGSIVTTQEVRVALDTDPANYTNIWTGSDQPIKFRYANIASGDFTSFGTGVYFAFYCRIETSAYTALSGDYNYAQILMSADGSAWFAYDLVNKFGDGVADGDQKWRLNYSVETRQRLGGHFVIGIEATSTEGYHQLLFGTDNANIGANYKVYQLMHGLVVDLPDISPEQSWAEEWYAGQVTHNPLGKVNWQGQQTVGPRRTFNAVFAETNSTYRDIIMTVFETGRGIYPMLWMYDTADQNTWHIVRFNSVKETEPQAGLFHLECEFEEY